MQVIASTNSGVLISATNEEVIEILRSVNGEAPKEIRIGQKIPAIDYAGSVTKLKSLKGAYTFTQLCSYVDQFISSFEKLKVSVENAASCDQEEAEKGTL
jgi:hypothetical protein